MQVALHSKPHRVADPAVQRPLFFFHALSSHLPLSLPSLRALISEVYLKRNDERIEELVAERRAGRPKSKELLDMEEVKRQEMAEWETGLGRFCGIT